MKSIIAVTFHLFRGPVRWQIAAELSVAPRTASAHVEHILAKLGVGRRTEIASWVALVTRPTGSEACGRARAQAVRSAVTGRCPFDAPLTGPRKETAGCPAVS